MNSVLVLGPSRWARAREPAGGTETSGGKRSDRRRPSVPTPLGLRRKLAESLEEHGIRAVLFEDWTRQVGESYSGAFRRLIRVAQVDRFLVLWPRHASLLGVDWELGFLASRIESGELNPRRIVLLLESGVVREDLEQGTASIGEPGNRTRYFEDLVTWECPISEWSNLDDLLGRSLHRALARLE